MVTRNWLVIVALLVIELVIVVVFAVGNDKSVAGKDAKVEAALKKLEEAKAEYEAAKANLAPPKPASPIQFYSFKTFDSGAINDYTAIAEIDLVNGPKDITRIDFKATYYRRGSEMGSKVFSVGDGTEIIIPRLNRVQVTSGDMGDGRRKEFDRRLWISPTKTGIEGAADNTTLDIVRVDTLN